MSEDVRQEDLADLFENAPCGYVSLAADGRIAMANRTFAGWLGRQADTLLSSKFSDHLSFGGRMAFETHIAPLLRLQGHVDEIAIDLLDVAKARIPVIVNVAEKKGGDGSHHFTRIALFKATDRRMYERSLLDARYKAEQEVTIGHETAQLREQFIAVLGHDLRNPLAALASGVQLLGKEPLSERSRMVVQQMDLSIKRSNHLINNVLDFARGRLGEGLILARNANEPLTPVLEQVVSEVRAFAPDRRIETLFDVREPVNCDRQRLGQVTANLISNAITHGAPDMPVTVHAHTVGETFVLSVANSGPAIPAEAQAKLFQPFFSGEARSSQQGLGLGLFIVDEIAKAHGGEMRVESDDKLTRFTFTMYQA